MSHREGSSGGKGDILREKKGGQEKILCQENSKNIGECARARHCEIQYPTKVGTEEQIEATM